MYGGTWVSGYQVPWPPCEILKAIFYKKFVMKGILNYQLRFIWWMNVLIINDCFMIFAERKKNIIISSRIPNEKLKWSQIPFSVL